jgi:hypothetical protein
MSRSARAVVGAVLAVISWLVAAGSLSLGLGREDGHLLAISIFGAACVIWAVAYKSLARLSRGARLAALFLPSMWGLAIVVAGALQLAAGYRDWFPMASACMLAITLAASLIRGGRKHREPGPGD